MVGGLVLLHRPQGFDGMSLGEPFSALREAHVVIFTTSTVTKKTDSQKVKICL